MTDIKFNRKKRIGNIKPRKVEDDQLEDELNKNFGEYVIDSVKEIQSLRKKPAGLSVEALMNGKKETIAISIPVSTDPYKMETGGLVDMRSLNKRNSDPDEIKLTQNFATETNKRDEDAEMLKYIEDEIAKRKGIEKKNEEKKTHNTLTDNLLAHVPDDLKPVIGQKNEDMLSNQMLVGIPEVDLGVEAKMRNIEATEEAKQRLLKERIMKRKRRNDMLNDLAPCNMSVNFVHHSRWNSRNMDTFDRGDNDDYSDMVKFFNTTDAQEEEKKFQAEKATDSQAFQKFRDYAKSKKR